jgi:DNA mismatch repair protein PMS2
MDTLLPFEARLHDTREVKVYGYVSTNDSKSCKTNASQQYTFLNGRPVDLPKLSRIMNECYRQVNPVIGRHQSFPIFILDITIPPDMVDVNMSPDKRTVLFVDQDHILQTLKGWLCRKLDPDGERTFELQILPPLQLSPPKHPPAVAVSTPVEIELTYEDRVPDSMQSNRMDIEPSSSAAAISTQLLSPERSSSPILIPSPPKNLTMELNSFEVPFQVSQQTINVESELDFFEPPAKRHINQEISDSDTIDIDITYPPPSMKKDSIEAILEMYKKSVKKTESVPRTQLLSRLEMFSANSTSNVPTKRSTSYNTHRQVEDFLEDEESYKVSDEPSHHHHHHHHHHEHHTSHGTCNHHQPRSEIEPMTETPNSSFVEIDMPLSLDFSVTHILGNTRPKLAFNMNKFSERYRAREARLGKLVEQQRDLQVKMKNLSEDDYRSGPQKIGSKRIRHFSSIPASSEKSAREEMTRQVSKSDFNNMVIIGQFNKAFIIAKLDEEIFILDQHACDEKYKFEELCKQKKVRVQTTLHPISLELSPPEAHIVLTNMDEFTSRGFRIEEVTDSTSAIHRLQLTGYVDRKSSLSIQEQIQEIVEAAREGVTAIQRLPSEYKAHASAACRDATMFGDPLSHSKMRTIVSHMSTMNQPWNCPHGRPTMRHLMSLVSKPK